MDKRLEQTDKKSDSRLEAKRLVIYLLLSFGLTWILFFAFILTGHKWDGTNPKLETFLGLGMLMPVLSHILTRKITGEGFAMTGDGSMMLGVSFKHKKWVFYLLAMLVPWVYFELCHALVLLFYPGMYQPEYAKTLELSKDLIWLVPVIGILSGTVVSFAAFGEEGGWRGYMMPKLMKLFGTKKAVLAGGIIWGLWHAPLTCVGHNFGTDYPGFPYIGILFMCIECTCMGIMLTYLTVKSGSVWPAAIMHAVNNTNPSILMFFIDVDKEAQIMPNPMIKYLIYLIPMAVLGGISYALLKRAERSQ